MTLGAVLSQIVEDVYLDLTVMMILKVQHYVHFAKNNHLRLDLVKLYVVLVTMESILLFWLVPVQMCVMIV